jgi:hypothetical protein
MKAKSQKSPQGEQMDAPNPGRQTAVYSVSHVVALALLAFCWHGFLLTNDGTIWDSWYVKSWLETKDWRALEEFFGATGLPLYGWLYKQFAGFSNIVGAFMSATVACLLLQPLLTYFLALELGGLSAAEAFCVAALSVSCPFFSAAQDLVMFFFVFMHTLFLTAALVANRSTDATSPKNQILRAAALLIFFTSFYNAALLVFYGGFFILLYFKWRSRTGSDESGQTLLRSAVRFVSLHLDFFLLPPLAWITKGILNPQFGWYSNYNNPLANLSNIWPSLKSFFINVPAYHSNEIFRWICSHPVLTILVFAAGFVSAKYLSRKNGFQGSNIKTSSLFLYGLLLLIFSIFPFAAAGKRYFSPPVGEPSRYSILTGLPTSILVFSLIRVSLPPLLRRTPGQWVFGVSVILTFLAGIHIPRAYISERAEWIVNRSLLLNAEKAEPIRQSSIVILQNLRMTSQIVYGTYAFGSAFKSLQRLVSSFPPQNGRYFTAPEVLMQLQRTTIIPNSLNRINPAGQQVLVVPEVKAEDKGALALVKNYLSLKWFSSTDALDEFLSKLTTVHTRILRTASPQIPSAGTGTESSGTNGDVLVNSLGMQLIATGDGMWVSKYETTQQQFMKVTGQNPSLFRDPNRPVEKVSWEQAADFCALLTETEKGAGRLPAGYLYRLPTCAEFRSLTLDADPTDAVLNGPSEYWLTQPVGSRNPNKLGLYDTVGNVWEWTLDWEDERQLTKLSAGGGFANTAAQLNGHPQAANFVELRKLFGPHRSNYPDQGFWDLGFRVVLARPVSPGRTIDR